MICIAAGDESDGPLKTGPFLMGGFAAPLSEWEEWFVPAWRERVLDAAPAIPYLHMAEIRNAKWRAKHGISRDQAERRVEEATRIIGSLGSLCPVKTQFDGGHFRNVFGTTRYVQYGNQPALYPFEPDFTAFIGFAYAAIEFVHKRYPDAERVDFLVERKTSITQRLNRFLEVMEQGFTAKGRPELVPLIGNLIPGGKDRIPLQAADVWVWHWRRESVGQAHAADLRRLGRMASGREIMENGMTNEQVSGMGLRAKAKAVPSPFPKKVRRQGSDGS